MEQKLETTILYRVILELYRENGKENGNYYLGFGVIRVKGANLRLSGYQLPKLRGLRPPETQMYGHTFGP